jgi:hypothetical protein
MSKVVLWANVRLVKFEDIRWPELTIEKTGGEIYRVRIGANKFLPKEGNYGRDALVAKVETLDSDMVDIWVHVSPWIYGDKSGVIYYMQDIKDANQGES